MSAVLSIADLSVGIIAVPNICFKILLFETLPWVIPCRLFIFFLYFPTSISWLLVIVAALDRCFLVLCPINYSTWMTLLDSNYLDCLHVYSNTGCTSN